jgi:hypothetical protein
MEASVLVPLHVDNGGNLSVLLTKRTDKLGAHRGAPWA